MVHTYIGDCDGTYDFSEIPYFISKLKDGYDLVIGNRFNSSMEKDSMPLLHKYIGNPVLSFFVRLFFRVKIKDVHAGARAISREAFEKLTLYTTGMEFASEMIIKSSKQHLKITEIPIKYSKRKGKFEIELLG